MAFGNEIKLKNISENWLFEIAGTSSTTLRFAFSDYTDSSNFYYGVILNKPSIRESINLKKSTAQTSSLSISIADFNYQGKPISQLLWGTSVYFINRVVTVKSVINQQTAVVIGYFRLNSISQENNTINLSMTSHRPWDFVDLPNTKTSRGKYIPVVYGNFTKNSNTSYISSESPAFGSAEFSSSLTSNAYFPVEYHGPSGGKEDFTTGIFDITSNAEGSHYDSGLNVFIPFTNPTSNTSTVATGHFATEADAYFLRGFGLRPNSFVDNHSLWTDEANAYNTNISDYAYYNATFSASSGTTNVNIVNNDTDIDFTLPMPTGKINQGTMVIEFQAQQLISGNSGSDTYDVRVYVDYTGTGNSWEQGIAYSASDADNSTDNHTITKAFSKDSSFPEKIKIGVKRHIVDDTLADGGATGSPNIVATTNIRIKDIKMYVEMYSEEKENYRAYCAGDGLTQGITGASSAAVTEIHEAHLDLLNRYTGLDVATNPATNITGWSALDTSKDWGIRYWQNKVEPLNTILERLQYEGGFIFRFKKGNTTDPSYIHIKDSYSSGDVSYTLTKEDLSDVQISIDSLSDLVTRMNINYDYHATESKHITNKLSSSSTARTNYNIGAKENIVDVKLNAYVSPTIVEYDSGTKVEDASPNNNFFAYYYNILGTPRVTISGSIVNPKFYDLDLGDIVIFSDMYPEKSFGQSFTDIAFMVTSLDRTPGRLKFSAREIAEIS